MQVDGGCLCGQVAYAARIDPEVVVICHCTDCQVHSGAAFGLIAGILGREFSLLRGSLKVWVKTAESGRARALSFCPDCGTRIHAETPGDPAAFFGLRVGTIRQRALLAPVRQVWCRSALPWTQTPGDLPRVGTQSG